MFFHRVRETGGPLAQESQARRTREQIRGAVSDVAPYHEHLPLVRRNPPGYTRAMITSFAHKGLEDFFYDGSKRGMCIRSTKGIFALSSRWCATLRIAALHGLRMPRRMGEGTVAGGFGCERLGTAGDGRKGTVDGTQDGRGSARTSWRGRHHRV